MIRNSWFLERKYVQLNHRLFKTRTNRARKIICILVSTLKFEGIEVSNIEKKVNKIK